MGSHLMNTAVEHVHGVACGDASAVLHHDQDYPAPGAALTQAAILSQLAEGVIVTDAVGRITLVNPAAAAIHGVARLDVEPQSYSDTYHLFTEDGLPYPPLDLPLARAVRGEVVVEAKWRIRRPDGAEVFAVGNAQPIRTAGGRQIGAILTLRDDSARETAERRLRKLNDNLARVVAERTAEAEHAKAEAELAQAAAEGANAAKSAFLASMSHEIRTPLNGVVAVADMLARADLPSREGAMVEIIRSSADTLQRLLSDILDMSRIESGKITLEAAPFHLGDTLRAVAALSQLRCDEKGVRLSVSIAPDIDHMVVGDMVRVRQIATNLLSNAVKFTGQGEVSLTAERLPGGEARLSVADTGVGFSMDDKAKVFGRFEQADSSITRRYGGSGLGLSICCDLAALMGGALDCESEVGVGSRFWVDLPLVAAPDAQKPDAGRTATEVDHVRHALCVLLADDHPTNRRIVELMLDGQGVELTCVQDGAEALEAFKAGAFDLILMDMQMPVMDGLTALRRIRTHEAQCELSPTPAIMLTANALPDHIEAGIAAGADLHLAKPFTTTCLFETIGIALEARSGQPLAT